MDKLLWHELILTCSSFFILYEVAMARVLSGNRHCLPTWEKPSQNKNVTLNLGQTCKLLPISCHWFSKEQMWLDCWTCMSHFSASEMSMSVNDYRWCRDDYWHTRLIKSCNKFSFPPFWSRSFLFFFLSKSILKENGIASIVSKGKETRNCHWTQLTHDSFSCIFIIPKKSM